MKAGIVGFFSMLCLFGLGVMGGARALDEFPLNDVKASLLTVTLYLVMHFMYACVDMSWDAASMVYVGVTMGVINWAEWTATQRHRVGTALASPPVIEPTIDDR